jgi:hypothetical protein
MLAQCVPELMIDQIASVAGQVGSIRVGAEQPAFGIQYDSIAVLARHLPTGHVWRARPVGRRRRHDVRVQGGRPPNRCQIETPVTRPRQLRGSSSTPASALATVRAEVRCLLVSSQCQGQHLDAGLVLLALTAAVR